MRSRAKSRTRARRSKVRKGIAKKGQQLPQKVNFGMVYGANPNGWQQLIEKMEARENLVKLQEHHHLKSVYRLLTVAMAVMALVSVWWMALPFSIAGLVFFVLRRHHARKIQAWNDRIASISLTR